jgi:hypothetical protein
MMRVMIALVTILSCSPLFAFFADGNISRLPYTSEGEGPCFFLDHTSYQGMEGKTYVEFYLQVGYRSLQFFKSGKDFRAGYSFTLEIRDSNGKPLDSQNTKDVFDVGTFEETLSRTTARVSLMAFSLPPGSYHVHSVLEDIETEKVSVVEKIITVFEFGGNVLQLSEIQFSHDIRLGEEGQPYVKNHRYIQPNAVRTFSPETGDIYLYFEIYNMAAVKKNSEYVAEFLICDAGGQQVGKVSRHHQKPGKTSAHSMRFGVDFFQDGLYDVLVRIRDLDNGAIAESKGRFRVVRQQELSAGYLEDPGAWYR